MRYSHLQHLQIEEIRVFTPEHRLLAAMLARAYLDYFYFSEQLIDRDLSKYAKRTVRKFEDARIAAVRGLVALEDWFSSDSREPMSFQFCCDNLAINGNGSTIAKKIRASILEPKKDFAIGAFGRIIEKK